MEVSKNERVIAYIDGYNLYFGLIDSGLRRLLWLDIPTLIKRLLKPNQELIRVNYFTTLVTNDINKRLRQKTFIGALQTLNLIQIFYGKFQKENTHCKKCGNDFQNDFEKMTDVAISVELIKDYYEDNFDMAMIVSGDTDLLPPIKFINEAPNNKRVFVAFPPNRVNDEVRKFAKGSLVIGRKNLVDSQLPEIIIDNGKEFKKPSTWI